MNKLSDKFITGGCYGDSHHISYHGGGVQDHMSTSYVISWGRSRNAPRVNLEKGWNELGHIGDGLWVGKIPGRDHNEGPNHLISSGDCQMSGCGHV